MKVTCPKCRKLTQAPDEWAGRTVKCPTCKNLIKLPDSPDGSTNDDLGFDIRSLGTVEAGGEVLVRERKRKLLSLKEAQRLSAEQADAEEPTDLTLRICPKCAQKVRCADPYAEVICSHCGTGIPGRADQNRDMARYTQESERFLNPVTFYGGFTSAAVYPLPALGSISVGMAIAFGSITIPLLAVLGFIAGANLNPISQKEDAVDYGWVGVFISGMFVAQAIYFGSVAYGVLIDTIRTTTARTETPPNLPWNIINIGPALAGYGILVAVYAIVILLLLVATNAGLPLTVRDGRTVLRVPDFTALGHPGSLIVLGLITYLVPMNLLGLASANPWFGLHPVRVGKSLLGTIGHYTFLFLVFLLYLGIYIGIMTAVLGWAGPGILRAAREGLKAGFFAMLGGLGAWSVVLGAGFYFAYCLGRILGLFSRTYQKSLAFEE